ILRTKRTDAAAAARRAGAVIHSGPSSRTTVVVRGRPNPLQAAGKDGGLKLMEIKRLREKGHRITLLAGKRCWAVVGRRGTEGSTPCRPSAVAQVTGPGWASISSPALSTT